MGDSVKAHFGKCSLPYVANYIINYKNIITVFL